MSSIYVPLDARLTDSLERRLVRDLALQHSQFNPFLNAVEGARKGLVKLYHFFKEVSADIVAARNTEAYIGR